MLDDIEGVDWSRSNRIIDPIYFDGTAEWFDGWTHESHGWGPAEGNSHQAKNAINSTDTNQFHLTVQNPPYHVTIRMGPETQEISLRRGHYVSKSGDVNEETVDAGTAPFVKFISILQDPAQFFP